MNALAADGAVLLADLALKGTVLLAAAVAAAWMLRRASAAARHLALGIALAALLALPVLAVALPAWRVPVLPGRSAPSPVTVSAPAAESDPSAAAPEIAGALQAAVQGSSGPAAARASARPQAPARHAAPVDRGIPLGALVFVLWATGAAAVLLRLGASLARVRRDGRAARPLEHGAAARALDAAVWRLGIDRPVRLLEGGPDSMPLTWGVLRPRVLLPSGTDAWPADRLQAVLTHELAHVRRRDCAWQLAAEAACALHWFNPLAWAAARRLRLESEHACDDHVLMAGSRGCDYAGHLLEVARTLRPPRHAALAGVAMARPSQLRTRLGAVLSADRRRGPVPRAAAAAALVAAAAIVAGVAAMTPAHAGAASAFVVPGTCSTAGRGQSEHDVVNGRDEWTVEWSNHARCGGSARIRGVRFSADFTDVASVSRGGFLRIELRDGGARTAVEVRPSGRGVVKTIRTGGASVPWDARADAWLAAAIAELMRHTDYATDARTAFVLAAGGPEALAAEIAHVTGSTRKRYADALLSAAARMDGAPRREALLALARTQDLDAEMQVRLLNAAVGLGSDAELSRFLVDAAPHLSRDARVVQAYGLATGRIGAGPLRDGALRAFERSWPLDQVSAPAEPAAPAEPVSPADPARAADPASASPPAEPARGQDGLPADDLDQPGATTTLRYTSDTGTKQSVTTLLAKDVTLTRDRRRIDRVSADGWLILREETGGATRRVEVRAAADGTLRFSWGGDFSGVDREDWLREMVAFFARQTAPRLRW